MTHHANVHCDRLPRAAAYAGGERAIRTPIRIHADADRDLLVLQSDVPVSPEAAREFGDCVADRFREESVTPLYLAGLAREGPDDEEDGSAASPPATAAHSSIAPGSTRRRGRG